MWSGIQGLFETTWQYSSRSDCAVGFLLALVLVLAAVFGSLEMPIFLNHMVIWVAVGLLLFFSGIIPPVFRMARRRHELILYVTTWSIISLFLLLSAFYFIFFAATEFSSEMQSKWDRILNLPPVIAGVLGAGIGWYVHQELNAKFHRTGNSFNLVMQAQTNSEFIQHKRKLTAVYALPDKIPSSDFCFMGPKKRVEIETKGRELEFRSNVSAEEKAIYNADVVKLQAIDGLKYILNFYEFMALGIRLGDLDETLLYETISPNVVGWFQASEEIRTTIRKDKNDKLAFEYLDALVNGRTEKRGRQEIEIEGWAKRLEKEKANV